MVEYFTTLAVMFAVFFVTYFVVRFAWALWDLFEDVKQLKEDGATARRSTEYISIKRGQQ
jgi:hypothetical protein